MSKIAVILYSDMVGGHEFQTIELIKDLSTYHNIDIYVDNYFDLKRLRIERLLLPIIKINIFKSGIFIAQLFHSIKLRAKYYSLFSKYSSVIVSGGSIEATIALGYALRGLNIMCYVPMFINRKKLWNSNVGTIYNSLHYLFCYPFKKIITINHIQAKLFSKFKPTITIPNRITDYNIQSKDTSSHRLYFVGRLEPSKGILELICMLDDNQNPFKEFIIVGDGSLYNDIKRIIPNLKHLKIKLMGWLDSKSQNEIFNASDVYITNSFLEGEPLSIREANSRKSIVIASDIDGHRGCVSPHNRYKTRQQLYTLLNKAYNNELPISKNYSVDEIENIRKRVIGKMFLQ